MRDIEALARKRFEHGRQSIARQAGFGACYVIGPDEAGPIKLGYASDVASRVSSLQTGCWERLWLFDVIWFQGPLIAERVEAGAVVKLMEIGSHIRGEWFKTDSSTASTAMRDAASQLGFKWFTEFDRRKRVEWMHQRQFEKLVKLYRK